MGQRTTDALIHPSPIRVRIYPQAAATATQASGASADKVRPIETLHEDMIVSGTVRLD